MSELFKIKLKKGDTVIVTTGSHKGKTGKVISTDTARNRVVVEGVNVVKRHIKPNKQHPQGGIVDETKSIDVSNVAIVEPSSKKPSKIGYKIDAKTNKQTRIYKRNGKEIS